MQDPIIIRNMLFMNKLYMQKIFPYFSKDLRTWIIDYHPFEDIFMSLTHNLPPLTFKKFELQDRDVGEER